MGNIYGLTCRKNWKTDTRKPEKTEIAKKYYFFLFFCREKSLQKNVDKKFQNKHLQWLLFYQTLQINLVFELTLKTKH